MFPKIAVPQNGWFITENPNGWFGGTIIFGNHHLIQMTCCRSSVSNIWYLVDLASLPTQHRQLRSNVWLISSLRQIYRLDLWYEWLDSETRPRSQIVYRNISKFFGLYWELFIGLYIKPDFKENWDHPWAHQDSAMDRPSCKNQRRISHSMSTMENLVFGCT